MDTVLKSIGVLVLCVLAIIFIPLCTIWALNTLFALGIAFSFKTWLAVIVLNITVLGATRYKTK